MSLSFTIRSPFADELPRVKRLLPQAISRQHVRVAVTGRTERISAAALLQFDDAEPRKGFLRFTPATAALHPELIPALLSPLIHEARLARVPEVLLVGSIAEGHPLGELLLAEGFERYRQTEVYTLDAATVLQRIETVHQRLVHREMIPPTARAVAPRGGWLPKLREFAGRQQRNLAERLDAEEGFTLEHSLLLVLDDDIKGAFFTRNRGRESYIGLILLAEELRGGLAWANTFMMREMLCFGVSSGVERLIFEVHPEDHGGSYQIARASGAELICRRWQFRQQFSIGET